MISIITPAYNSARYLRSCVESVARQWQEGIEHWVIDGGSTDGTIEMLEQLANEFPHLNWISEKDRGQSHAMNKGIALCKGSVISFLNADDFYEEGALETAIQFFRNAPENTFLVGDCRVLKQDGTESMINRPYPFDPVAFILDYKFPFNPSAYFYHKSLHSKVGLYDEADHLTMDIDFIFRLFGKANIQYTPRILGNYVLVESSKTMQEISAGRNVENLLKVFARYEPGLSTGTRLRLGIQRMMGKHRGWIMYYLENPGAFFRKMIRQNSPSGPDKKS